jgi:pyrimidine-nucleoside phosphorylase
MLVVAGALRTRREAHEQLVRSLDSGAGLERLAAMVEAHGGDPRAVFDPDRLPKARRRAAVVARESGYVRECDAYALGEIAVELGAGRTRADQSVDPAAGIELAVVRGERAERGQPLAWLHTRRKIELSPLVARTAAAFRITARAPRAVPRILRRISR